MALQNAIKKYKTINRQYTGEISAYNKEEMIKIIFTI